MTIRRASSLAAIAGVARALGDDRERVVFVGGTTVALYHLEDGADVRPTFDVDLVVDVTTTAEHYAFVEQLRARGFRECTDDGAPLCRLVVGTTRVDVAATSNTGIVPTNRWYQAAFDDAVTYVVEPDLSVRAIAPLYFVATKLEAFADRGKGDYRASHDLEDALAVVSGLAALRDEIEQGTSEVALAVRTRLAGLASQEAFMDAVPGHFDGDAAGRSRADAVQAWLGRLT